MKTNYCLVLHTNMYHKCYEVKILEKNDTSISQRKGIEHKLENSSGLFSLDHIITCDPGVALSLQM